MRELNRRDFLKYSGMVGGGLVAADDKTQQYRSKIEEILRQG